MSTYKAAYTHSDMKILDHEIAFKGYFRIERYRLQHRLFNGNWSEPISREIFERGCAAGALLYDPSLDHVVLIEQFRAGASQGKNSPWLLEIVAGIIDDDDASSEQTVRREIQEEANLSALDLLPICDYWVSPGGCTERMSLFLARVDARHAGGIYGLSEEQEDIQVISMPRQDAMAALEAGTIDNASAIIALQWLALNLNKVQEKWLVDNGL